MTVYFSWSQVAAGQARRLRVDNARGQAPRARRSEDQARRWYRSSLREPFAESAQYTLDVPHDLVDDTGRTLANASGFPLTVRTDEFPPLAKFSARFGIIESADPVLPVTLRNLEPQLHGAKLDLHGATDNSGLQTLRRPLARKGYLYWRVPPPNAGTVLTWLRKAAEARRDRSVFGAGPGAGAKTFTIPKPGGAKAFEVVGIPLDAPGLYIVELSKREARLGAARRKSVRRCTFQPRRWSATWRCISSRGMETTIQADLGHLRWTRPNPLPAPTWRSPIAPAPNCGRAAHRRIAESRWCPGSPPLTVFPECKPPEGSGEGPREESRLLHQPKRRVACA